MRQTFCSILSGPHPPQLGVANISPAVITTLHLTYIPIN